METANPDRETLVLKDHVLASTPEPPEELCARRNSATRGLFLKGKTKFHARKTRGHARSLLLVSLPQAALKAGANPVRGVPFAELRRAPPCCLGSARSIFLVALAAR